ncbi:MAG: glycosyltransferase family 2 protein [Acidobacteriia bacterium]|nr:glycosyltransferase family 2 protein [Terriglobia bacterium]
MNSRSEKPTSGIPLTHETPALGIPISIIIPAYNEAARLPRALERIRDYIEQRQRGSSVLTGEPGPIEVIVVDDGSQDGTAEIVLSAREAFPGLRLVSNGRNRGKGYSVRHGMLEAAGRIALFTDADLSAPIEEMEKLLGPLASADVAIGSRALERSLIAVRQSKLREIAGKTFNALVQLITGVRFRDTQCGFKAFVVSRTRIIFEQQRIEGFGFDPELLFLAKRHGFSCVEIPIRWAHDPATKVRVVRDSFRMFCDLARIRWNWFIGRYPRAESHAFAADSPLEID